jgi:alpha-beta hydrolase superfamily lysophospholipase
MRQRLLNALLFFPSGAVPEASAVPDLAVEEMVFAATDGERLNGWWVPSRAQRRGHVLLCHGNGGDIGDRIAHARLLTMAGFDVLLFDYRGFGRSSGRPSVEGTYRDALAAHAVLLERADDDRVFYLGESLGGAVALALALRRPPAGLILQSAFTSVRDMARLHYPYIPRALVPDAYPSIALIRDLRAPLIVLHGERDDIVPASHADALYDAAPEPKRIQVFERVGHNDLVAGAAEEWMEAIAGFAEEVTSTSR